MFRFFRWKSFFIWLAVAVSILVALPNVLGDGQLSAVRSVLPVKTLRTGLDLQGGSHFLLKIERSDIVDDRSEAIFSDIRSRLRSADVHYSGLSGAGQKLEVRISDPGQLQDATAALSSLADPLVVGSVDGKPVREVAIDDGRDGVFHLTITDEGIDCRLAEALSRSVEVVRARIAALGYEDPLVETRGANRIVVQVPGLPDPQRLKGLLDQRAEIQFRMVDKSMAVADAMNTRPPANSEILYTMDDPAIPYLLDRTAIASSADIADARVVSDPATGEPGIVFQLDGPGTERFAQATQDNPVGTYAVVLDGQVISTTVIGAPVLDGKGLIFGAFSDEGVRDLALMLRAGALPATLTVVEERTVEPGLGAEWASAGLIAGVTGAGLVAAFMLGFYGFLGAVAVFAMAVNVVMIIAILTALGLALTLPGIAGIVLTMGMAVDSNVLIYERIREEAKSGRNIKTVVREGFLRAGAAIGDANLATLIAALVLLFASSGPVRGFAVTVTIGVFTTVFTAYTLTRWIVLFWAKRTSAKALPKGMRTGVFDGTAIRFMSLRRFTFAVSAALSIAAMSAFMTFGVNVGIDFSGGSIVEMHAREGTADLDDVRSRLGELNLGEARVERFGGPEGLLIRVPAQGGGDNAEQSAVTLIRGEFEDAFDFRRVEVVGPAVSGELTRMATLGVLASLIAIVVYLSVRFQWQFALGAIVATLHDVILTIGLFVVTGIEFNLASVAALLTIVGYSLNDTVVVYDRMREYLRKFPKMPLRVLIDASINQTLSRTVLTGATTMLALIALILFGGEVVRSFAIVMLFGVAVGTFSSIYMAAPVLIMFRLRNSDPDPDEDPAGQTAERAV